MTIKIYNTLTKKKEEFKPLEDKRVHIYVCGPTVYDYSHIGHARTYASFDVMRRYFEYRGYKVTYVNNFTDVNDKIVKRAKEIKDTPEHLSEKFSEEFLNDMDALGIKRADHYPKVSENMEEIQDMIKALIEKGYAYEADGDVYYRVHKFESYRELANLKQDEIKAGARVEIGEKKENPEDFALWRKTSTDEQHFDSPWGPGRPGWHIECSVMSMKLLGSTLDIHGGGQDLIFPHHTNEIAQSEAYSGKKFSNYWIHNGFVTLNKEKMSKSLGNFFTIREILEKYDPQVVRFFLIEKRYRSPIDFSDEHLEAAAASLERIHTAIENIKEVLEVGEDKKLDKKDKGLLGSVEAHKKAFIKAMDDDFNTRIAISEIFGIVGDVNKYMGEGKTNSKVLRRVLDTITELDGVLNLFQPKETEVDDEVVSGLIRVLKDLKVEENVEGKAFEDLMDIITKMRDRARDKKDYETADELREKLSGLGIILEDKEGVTRWRLAKR